METLTKVSTWLPGFTGFYGSVFEECGEDQELENINDIRREKKLEPVELDVLEFDYTEYFRGLSKDITKAVSHYLIEHRFITDYEFQKLSSPKEYNFSNDAIHVAFFLSKENQKNITDYLYENKDAFSDYLEERYSSCSGFISYYSNSVGVWLNDEYLTHDHKLGSVLNFIFEHHLRKNENVESLDMWLLDQVSPNTINATNYTELTEGK